MDKTWLALIGIGVVEVMIFVGYEFYLSLSGQNIEFIKKLDEQNIPADLGIQQFELINTLDEYIIIENGDLDN